MSLLSMSANPVDCLLISIVSNSRLLHEGLTTLLPRHLTLRCIGNYAGPPASQGETLCPGGHIVLLDSNVGQLQAIDWVRHWRGFSVLSKVIVIELIEDTEAILTYIEAGVSGYALKGVSSHELAPIIRQVDSGEAPCSSVVAASLFQR